MGNFIEWYDIGVYGYLAVTMPAVFTAGMDQSVGLVVTLPGLPLTPVSERLRLLAELGCNRHSPR
ncbi:MAG TPA: hypothetical protein DIS84_09465 [Corynebacterium stationis]|nr:hypothetical protein [Corynebacterium stationis]